MMDVSINLIVVIILKYIHTSNHHVVDLKLTKCCMSIKLEKKKRKTKRWGKTEARDTDETTANRFK